MTVDFPYHVDGRGRTAGTTPEEHVRDLIEQVLFTAPGERVMRPGFGAGLLQLVLEPAGPQLAATTQYLVQAALEQHLGDRVVVTGLDVSAQDAVLAVTLSYVVTGRQDVRTATFPVPGGLP